MGTPGYYCGNGRRVPMGCGDATRMLSRRSIVFALAVAFIAGWLMQHLSVFWAWPMALAITLASSLVFNQKEAYNAHAQRMEEELIALHKARAAFGRGNETNTTPVE